MAECNWCDSNKWFFQLDRKSGVCAECVPKVKEGIAEHVQALDAAEKPAADADWQIWLAHHDGIRSHLSALLRYEGRGIPALDPSPSVAMVGNDDARAEVILAAATAAVDTALTKAAEEAAGAGVAVANEALAHVKEFQVLLGEPLPEFGDNNATVLVKLENKVEAYIAQETGGDAPPS